MYGLILECVTIWLKTSHFLRLFNISTYFPDDFDVPLIKVVLDHRLKMLFMFSSILLVCVLLTFILTCLKALECWTQHKNEPPILANSIPFITPLLGMLKQRTNFMVQMR